jgi:hypothetical protein
MSISITIPNAMQIYSIMQKLNADDRIFGLRLNKSTGAEDRVYSAEGLTMTPSLGLSKGHSDFDAMPIWSDIVDSQDIYGNVFSRIPKHYQWLGEDATYKYWCISKKRHSGFFLPWCFWDFTNAKELDYLDVGKYKASLAGDNKLESKAGKYPLVGTDIVDFRTYAENNNTGGLLGYQLLDIHSVEAVLRTLAFIELGTLDVQSVMQGYTAGQYSATHTLTANTTDTTLVVTNATGANYRVGQAISVGTSLGGNQRFYGRTITQIDADTPSAGSTTITFDGANVSLSIGDILYNIGWKNGFSINIAGHTGSIGSNSDGKYPCVYRGIESPFGDIWQFVDGINISGGGTWADSTLYTVGILIVGTDGNVYRCTTEHTSAADTEPVDGVDYATVWTNHGGRQAWIALDANDYASNVFASPYVQLGYTNAASNNYVITMGRDENYPFAQFPTSVGAIGSSPYKDYYYQATGAKVALFGGRWSNGVIAGLSSWNLDNSSANTHVSFGSRLLKKAL